MKILLIGILTFSLFIQLGCKTTKRNKADLKVAQPEKVKFYTAPDSLPKECINLPNFQYTKDSSEIFYQVSFKINSGQEALEKFKILMANPVLGRQLFSISGKGKLDSLPNQFTVPIYHPEPTFIIRSSGETRWESRLSYKINLKLKGDTAWITLNKIRNIRPPVPIIRQETERVGDGISFSGNAVPLELIRAFAFHPKGYPYYTYISNNCVDLIQMDITMKKLLGEIKKNLE